MNAKLAVAANQQGALAIQSDREAHPGWPKANCIRHAQTKLRFWQPARSLLLIACLISTPAHAQIDTLEIGMSDFWQRHFNNGNLFDPQNPAHASEADLDGDGWSNLQESIAGTDPFDANPPDGRIVFHITYLSNQEEAPSPDYPEGRIIDIAVVSWDTVPGKQYILSFSPDLTAGSWLAADVPYYGDGLPAATSITLNDSEGFKPDKLFWRVQVADIDSDNDGLNDYEESLHGTNPFIWDTSGNGVPDGHEFLFAGQFSIWPPDLISNLNRNQSEQREVLLFNDTDGPVNFTMAIADHLGLSYRYEDSISGNVAYTWEEISTTGTLLANVSDHDDASQYVDLNGFTFPFHGNNFSRVHISSNGLIALGAASPAYYNLALPSSSAPANLIVPFWDDLDTRTIGDVYFKVQSDRLIIQYENCGRNGGGTTSAYTFQVVLHADGRIHFRYKSMVGVLNSATIGLQDSSCTLGLQIAYNAAYVANETAVEISPLSEFVNVSPLQGTVAANSVLALGASFQSLQIPFGTHTATLTTTHDATSATADPIVTTATLNVLNTQSTVAFTAPANNTSILQGDTIALNSTASDPQGMEKVEFYSGVTKIGESIASSYTTTTYNWTWSNPAPPVGIHTLTAHAIDIFGAVTNSAPITLNVLADENNNRIPDVSEIESFGNLDQEASGDFDGDGFPNIFEYHHGTDPADPANFPIFSETQTTTSPLAQVGPVRYYLVDSAFPTITTFHKKTLAQAYSAASDFDIIEVMPGTYPENLTLSKRLYLFSSEGAQETILDGTGKTSSILNLTRESVVHGFTLRNYDHRNTTSQINGGGIQFNVTVAQDKPWIVGCVITDNAVTYRGGGIYIQNGSPTFVSCTIAGNFAANGAGIFNLPANNQVRLINTLLWNPAGDGNDLAGQLGNLTQEHTLTRNPASGAVAIDGVPLQTNNPGLAYGWQLTHDSPARNAGTTGHYAHRDMHGESRPFGPAPDIGADEFVDTDSGLLPDFWEILHFNDLTQTWDNDSESPEGDGLINLYEYQLGFDPNHSDTLGAGMGDLYEAIFSDRNAPWYPGEWKIDFDGDGLIDAEELYYETDPNNPDSNGDGILDSVAIQLGFDPNNPDTDGDGIPNHIEILSGTNPLLADTDGDGVSDSDDAYPLDPDRTSFTPGGAGDTAAPSITLLEPLGAVPIP